MHVAPLERGPATKVAPTHGAPLATERLTYGNNNRRSGTLLSVDANRQTDAVDESQHRRFGLRVLVLVLLSLRNLVPWPGGHRAAAAAAAAKNACAS